MCVFSQESKIFTYRENQRENFNVIFLYWYYQSWISREWDTVRIILQYLWREWPCVSQCPVTFPVSEENVSLPRLSDLDIISDGVSGWRRQLVTTGRHYMSEGKDRTRRNEEVRWYLRIGVWLVYIHGSVRWTLWCCIKFFFFVLVVQTYWVIQLCKWRVYYTTIIRTIRT